MHFPIEFLLLGLVGEGSRWIGNKGWLPPKESGMPFRSRGKAGYLGADGKPAIDENDKPLTAKQKAAIMKKEEQMKAAEMGIEVKPEKKAKAKTGGTSYASQKKELDKGGTISLGSGERTYNDATERYIENDYRLRRASGDDLRKIRANIKEGDYAVERRTRKGDEVSDWQIMTLARSPEEAIAKSNGTDFRVAVIKQRQTNPIVQRADKAKQKIDEARQEEKAFRQRREAEALRAERLRAQAENRRAQNKK